MKLYPIREVSEITGIKPVTLRAWQRRYGLIQPQRTESGHRLYTEENIERIRLIQSWLAKGVSIGKVKDLLERGEPAPETEAAAPLLGEVEQLLAALARLNRNRVESILAVVLKEYPLEIVMQQFFYPVLESLERVKSSQRSLQKALLQSLLTSKAAAMIDAENKAFKKSKALVVNLDGTGSLAAWMSAVMLSERGYGITLLDGVDDISGLDEMLAEDKPDLVYFFANRALPARTLDSLRSYEAVANIPVEYSETIQSLALQDK